MIMRKKEKLKEGRYRNLVRKEGEGEREKENEEIKRKQQGERKTMGGRDR